MSIIGYNGSYDGYENTMSFMACKFTAPTSGNISSIFAFIHQTPGSDVNYQVGVYSDDGGSPSSPATNLVYSSSYLVPNGTYNTWIEIPISTLALTNGVIYWLVLQVDTASLGGLYVKFAMGSNQFGEDRPYDRTFGDWSNNPSFYFRYNWAALLYANIALPPTQQTIDSDARILVTAGQVTLNSDAEITLSNRQYLASDAKILSTGNQKILNSTAKILVPSNQQTITSGARIVSHTLKNITSTAKISDLFLYDINNSICFAAQATKNITNKFNSVIGVLSNIANRFVMAQGNLSNIANDFRTQKGQVPDISNDCRFVLSYQRAANLSIQSLGKSYIRIYINNVEQTDVDVDSIRIEKALNTSHTASFSLSRAYDGTTPIVESTVVIKYNNWVLYKGYIHQITKLEEPEQISIECESKFTEDSEHNKYFFVGHRPYLNTDLYYETIYDALTAQFGWSPDIGKFTPYIMNEWGVKESESVTQLVQECGNYGWYYDVNENRTLWTGGAGRIVNIHRQELGKNIDLFDLLDHQFTSNIDDIVNKYIVLIGPATQTHNHVYQGYNYQSFIDYPTPAWNRTYERLARYSPTGESWDMPTPDTEKLYTDIWKVYNFSILNLNEEYTDQYPPAVQIDIPYGYKCTGPTGVITEGFTIDYKNSQLIFNEPIYCYLEDGDKEFNSVQAPTVTLLIWKKSLWTYTTTETDNPETDASNIYKIITNKVGSYPDTLTEVLLLPNLNIKGIAVVDGRIIKYAKGWDDTEFAKDYAYWQLSKTAEEQITGNVKLTLDNICYSNIDLTDRIYSSGITTTPMNILSMSYDLSSFTVTLSLQNITAYKRTVSLQARNIIL
jgi:hypothetical protein